MTFFNKSGRAMKRQPDRSSPAMRVFKKWLEENFGEN
jgi:hypothetical protein